MLTQALKDEYERLCYKGGAGPDEEQCAQLDALLVRALKAHQPFARHFTVTLIPDKNFGTLVSVGEKLANYDRHGYSTIHCNALDNADLETTVAWFLK